MSITIPLDQARQVLEALNSFPHRHLTPSILDTRNAFRQALAEQPAHQEPVADEVRCPECGYLTKHTEHIGCLRKKLNAINAFEQRNFAIVNMDKAPPAQQEPVTEAQIVAGARVLNRRMADMCNIDAEDQWKQYGEDFRADARAVLEAARNIKENT